MLGANGGGQLGLATPPAGATPWRDGRRPCLPSTWGRGDRHDGHRRGNPSSITTAHTCAALLDRTLRCWGSNSSGQIGVGDEVALRDGPGEMGDASCATSPAATGAPSAACRGPTAPPLDGALVARCST
ncbi:MAG: hypothetical protein H6518_12975 [Microthrixaceae bacterium]|nr:hypothetical protein [Microthrixaceae bacterium]